MSSKLTAEQFGKLVALLGENGYAVIPLTAFQGARPVQSAPVQAPAPAVEAEGERKYKCSVCGEEGHNARTCPTRAQRPAPAPAQAKPAPAPAPAPALDLDSFDLDLDLGAPVAAPAPKPAPAPAPKAKPAPAPAPAPTVATRSEIDAELEALFSFG